MQRDFHFYAIGMLARHAGFSDEGAVTIATASQYVDHATDCKPIRFDDGRVIEAVMTAHYHLESFSRGVQHKVFMCFHFPPVGHTRDGFSFVTRKNAPLIRELLKDILADKPDETTMSIDEYTNQRRYWLVRLGIALHTYADSWSHATFSGRDHRENEVSRFWFRKNGEWREPTYNLAEHFFTLAPTIGHAQSGFYPDQPFRVFRYGKFDTKTGKIKRLTRDNPKEFRDAAWYCLDWLRRFANTHKEAATSWDENKPAMKAIARLIDTRKEKEADRIQSLKKSPAYRNHFDDLFKGRRDFKPDRWKNQALALSEKDETHHLGFSELDQARPKPGFAQSHFWHFHKAARLQRQFMIERLFWRL